MAIRTVNVTAINTDTAAHLTGGTAKIYRKVGYDTPELLYSGALTDPIIVSLDDAGAPPSLLLEVHKPGYWTGSGDYGGGNSRPFQNARTVDWSEDQAQLEFPISPIPAGNTITVSCVVRDYPGGNIRPGVTIDYFMLDIAAWSRSGYVDGYTFPTPLVTDEAGRFQLVFPRPSSDADGAVAIQFRALKDEYYWSGNVAQFSLSPLSDAVIAMTLNNPVQAYLGTNKAVITLAEPAPGKGSVWIYGSDQYEVRPHVDIPAGHTQVEIDHLGAGPYTIEIDLPNPPDYRVDGLWPHSDTADPDAWNFDKATQFTLSPGVNDLGTFHFADYPAKCTRTFPKKEAKLRKVGFSQKAAALLLKPPVQTGYVLHHEHDSVGHQSVDIALGPPVVDADLGFVPMPTVLPAVNDAYIETGYIKARSTGEISYLTNSSLLTGSSLSQNYGAWSSGPGPASGTWYPYVLMTDYNYTEAHGQAWDENALTPALRAFISGPDPFRDLLRAGFSPRQARTWLRVKGMEPYFDFALYPHAGGTQRTIGGTQSLHIPAGFDISTVIAGYEYGITSSVGQPDAGESWWNLSQPVYRRSNGHAGPLTTAGEFYFWLHKSGGDQLAVWTDEAKAAVNALGASLGLPDRRLDALIRGGFTTAQARLLLETL